MLALCLRRLQDVCDAEDAAQETFVRALGHEAVFAAPVPWLLRVATNICIDHFRRRQTRELLLSALRIGFASHTGDWPEFDDMDRLLSFLTAAERKVITATILEDHSHIEAGELLGISASTSRVLQSRALRKLRDQELADGAVV